MIIKRYWHFRYLDQRFSGTNDPKTKQFWISLLKIFDGTLIHISWPNLLKVCWDVVYGRKKNLSWTLSALDLCMCTLFGSDLLEFAWVIVCPMLCDASTEYKFTCVCVCRCVCLLGWLRGTGTVVVCRTLVFDRRTFAVLRLTVRPAADGWPICG